MHEMRRKIVVALILVVCVGAASASPNIDLVVYSNNFDDPAIVAPGITAVLDGVVTVEPVQNYSGVGSPGNIFSGDFLRNTTGGDPFGTPSTPTRITLTGLPNHTSVSVRFLLAIIDSWDGTLLGCCPEVIPDFFTVLVDGVAVFDESFGFNGATYVPPVGVLVVEGALLGFDPGGDAAYDMSLDAAFQNLPHTADSVTLEWFANGLGWQGGDDESFALENVEIVLGGVDPASKEDCEKGGWEAFGFKNQGQCIRFVNTGKDSRE